MKTLIVVLACLSLSLVGCGKGGGKPADDTFVNPLCNEAVPVDTNPAQDDILIIGDSISLGYTPYVQAALAPLEVIHNPCNGQSTRYALYNMQSWMAMRPHYKMIVFNQGLWDLAIASNEDPGEYYTNLIAEVNYMKQFTDHMIFLTTTYVPLGADGRLSGTENTFNDVAVSVMNAMGVPVYDLYTVSRTLDDHHVDPTNVYYDNYGYSVLGDFVTQSIKTELGI